MLRFVASRGVRLLAVLLGVSFLSQLLIELLPGDPTTAILGLGASEESRAALRESMNLDQSPVERYVDWLGGALHGDLGTSVTMGTSVSHTVAARLPLTLELILGSIGLALLVAVPLALYTADRAEGWAARVVSVFSLVSLSTPVFIVGVLLAAVVGLWLGLLDVSGYEPLSAGLGPHLRSMALPVLTLALGQVALYFRMFQGDLVATLREDYILLARARGFSRRRILWLHALRPSFTSLLTVVGLSMGALVGGTVIVESLFGLPGLGRLLIDASLSRDFVTVQGVVIVIAFAYVAINLTVDILYAVLDPRIRS